MFTSCGSCGHQLHATTASCHFTGPQQESHACASCRTFVGRHGVTSTSLDDFRTLQVQSGRPYTAPPIPVPSHDRKALLASLHHGKQASSGMEAQIRAVLDSLPAEELHNRRMSTGAQAAARPFSAAAAAPSRRMPPPPHAGSRPYLTGTHVASGGVGPPSSAGSGARRSDANGLEAREVPGTAMPAADGKNEQGPSQGVGLRHSEFLGHVSGSGSLASTDDMQPTTLAIKEVLTDKGWSAVAVADRYRCAPAQACDGVARLNDVD